MAHFVHRNLALAAILASGALIGSHASAQNAFPTKSIKIVMPIPAGSALDVVTRVVAENLSGQWGQQVVVENRPGALGAIAAQSVAGAPADGYTLLGGASSIFTIMTAQKGAPAIDVNKAFTQIGMIVGNGIMHLAVPPRLG